METNKLTLKRFIGILLICLMFALFMALIGTQIDEKLNFIILTTGWFFGELAIILLISIINWLME
jgi:hypothetical protein